MIMIENEIYCYINGFLKCNISKKTSYIVGNKEFFGRICILHLRNYPFTIASVPPCSFLSLFFFAFLFHLLFLLSLTLIGIIYCLNYTSLLLHLVTTQLLSHPFLSSIIFTISTLIIGIFYCLNYTSLLLHLIITHLVIDFIITM